ncbi:methionyl-tRNA formyltransferase [Nitrospinota bacterium]
MRVVFLGTPEFALPALEAILSSSIEVVAVFTQPDRPAGRGRKLTPPAVKVRALEHGLEVLQPERVRAADISPFSPDAAVVAAYGQYLSSKLIAVPRLSAVNIHPSLLPRWRGAAPIQRALLAGDTETGVCSMRVAKEMDAGAVLGKVVVPIGPRDTSEDLHDKLASASGPLILDTLVRLERNEVAEEEQDESLVTYAEKLTKEEARLDWPMSGEELDRRVRGLRPWPVADTPMPGLDGGSLRIWRAFPLESEPGREASPGEVLGETETPEGPGLRVRAGGGDLSLLEVQPPGGRRMTIDAFLRGHPLPPGAVLGNPK